MSLLLEALKKAEKSKQENAARQDARISPGSRAPETVSEPLPAPEPLGNFDLSELTLAPPRETPQREQEDAPGETAFPEISLLEAEPAKTPDLAVPPEISAWEPPAPEVSPPTQNAEAVSPPPETPAIELSMDLPESPAGRTEPLLTLDFPQPKALQETAPPPPEPAPRPPETSAVAPEPAPAERIAPQLPYATAPEPAAAPTSPPEPVAAPVAPPARAAASVSGAEAAKKILAASRGKPASNPKVLGGILLVSMLAGAAGYYYYQQTLAQPGIVFQVPPPAAQAPLDEPPAAVPPTAPESAPSAESPAAPAAPTTPEPAPPPHDAPAVVEKPVTPPLPPARPEKRATAKSAPSSADTLSGSVPDAPVSPATPAAAVPAKQTVGAAGGDSGIKIRRDSGETRLDPLLAAAWQAYMAGDIARAENDYRKALKQQPNSRDALLGLAAIAGGRGQPDEAAAYYQKILQLDPRDAAAQAGLIGLRGYSDPNASESRLKILLGQSPEAGYLHFALGNLYAHQSRWPEAQEAYFNALHGDANNADYAFNLAVSLDHLDQHRLALEYYRRALDLAAQGRSAGFDRARAKNRVQELLPPQE